MAPVRRSLVWAAAIFAVLLGGGGGAYLIVAERDRPIYADSSDARLVGLGSTVYARQCAACHGIQLEGQPNWQSPLPTGGRPAPPHDETGHTWHHPDRVLFELTKFGGQPYSPADYQSNMPAFEGILTDREILATLAFIKSSWPAGIRARQQRVHRPVAAQ